MKREAPLESRVGNIIIRICDGKECKEVWFEENRPKGYVRWFSFSEIKKKGTPKAYQVLKELGYVLPTLEEFNSHLNRFLEVHEKQY